MFRTTKTVSFLAISLSLLGIFSLGEITLAATDTKITSEFQIIIDFLLKILPLAGWIFGVLAWWDTARGKKFAAESDFKKIKERLEEVAASQEVITQTIQQHERKTFDNFTNQTNQIFRELTNCQNEIKICQQLVNHVQIILSSGTTSGFSKKND